VVDTLRLVSRRNEYLAVRNADGSFYLCQAHQNIYRTSKKISIQWFGEAPKEENPDGALFAPEYYDKTDFETILTSVTLEKAQPSAAAAKEAEDKSDGKKKKRGRTPAPDKR
jgi:hypothetical protein